jgi:hypothetical protein
VISSGNRTVHLSDGSVADHGPTLGGPGQGGRRVEAVEQLDEETRVLDSQGTDTQTALVF